jgi:uncharacterized membrane protein
MLEVYFGVSLFLTGVSVVAIFMSLIVWAMDRADYKHNRKKIAKSARRALYSLAFPAVAWLWPLTVPLAVLYLISQVAKDATLPRN